MPIFVDCDWGKKNKETSDKYAVRGYPTVIFTDPDGKELEKLGRRDADSVLAQINKVAEKYPKK
jgi:thioredoxin-related protein